MHPLLNPVAPYRYLLQNMYFSVVDKANLTFLGVLVVEFGLVSTSLAFMRNSASHPAGPHGRLSPKNGEWGPIAGGGRGRNNLHSSFPDRCDSYIACMLCRLEPFLTLNSLIHTPAPSKWQSTPVAPNDTAYKRWSCHSGLKLLCK